MSARKAWCRLHQKFSPSKKTNLSPIKQVCFNSAVIRSLTKDRFTKPSVWTILNTEEFYYQTTCSLVFHEFQNENQLSQLLRDTRIKIKWKERLKDLTIVGQGTFGDVYKGQDNITERFYALKKIVKRVDIDLYAEIFIKNILQEKSILAELNKSEFFVKLLGAFQDSESGAYWFVMEYCLCDLRKLASVFPSFLDDDYLFKNYIEGNLMDEVNKYLSEIYEIDYKRLVFLYLFEMLCALHYLATKHIKHADLKLDNILVTTTGHIKMADFGLAFVDNWFYRNSISLLVIDESYMNRAEELDDTFKEKGNPLHHDPEMVMSTIMNRIPAMRDTIKMYYGDNPYMNRLVSFEQIFLTDLFAVGFITIQLLFGGLNLKKRPKEYRKPQTASWALDISYNEEMHEKIIVQPILGSSQDKQTSSVLQFLISLMKPREIRAMDFVSTIKIFERGRVKEEKYINIDLVENIPYYKTLAITKMSVLNKVLPENFINAIVKNCQQIVKDVKPCIDDPERKIMKIPGFDFTDSGILQ